MENPRPADTFIAHWTHPVKRRRALVNPPRDSRAEGVPILSDLADHAEALLGAEYGVCKLEFRRAGGLNPVHEEEVQILGRNFFRGFAEIVGADGLCRRGSYHKAAPPVMMNSQRRAGIEHCFHVGCICIRDLDCHRTLRRFRSPAGFDEQRQVGPDSLGIDVPWVNTHGAIDGGVADLITCLGDFFRFSQPVQGSGISVEF
jgi:hypothetical protein